MYPNDRHRANLKETSAQIEENLLDLTASEPALNSALTHIFNDPGWLSQIQPIDAAILRQDALRPKVFNGEGNGWYPCQLGCVDGVPHSGSKITQPNRMTEHIEWHLGMRRHACCIWHVTGI
jgi:hypothetical protein